MITRILARLMVLLSLSTPLWAGVTPGSISGYVRNSSGVVQMGASVEVFSKTGLQFMAYTDAKGYFTLSGLTAGSYDVRVSAPSFLPTLREDVALAAGASKVLNITLNTLFDAVRMLPQLKRDNDEDDSWRWTLRSTANRPILRFDDGTAVIVESASQEKTLAGAISYIAGGSNEGYGSTADLGASFDVQQSIFHTGVLGFDGNMGSVSGSPDGVMRASYKRDSQTGWTPVVALTVRHFATPDLVPQHGALDALALSYSDGFSIGDLMDFQYGGDAQAIQFLGHEVNAFRPSAVVDFHLGDNTILEYRYATEEPNTRGDKGFDTSPADLSESGPRMTMVDGAPLVENAHHHELSLSQREGDTKLQLAYYNDRVKDPALLAVGDVYTDTGDILPDVYSGTFSYNGGELEAQGVRVVMQHKFGSDLTATVDYGYGGVLTLDQPNINWTDVRNSLQSEWRHTAALKLNGTLRRSHTRWIASYRWTSGEALSPVDLFNASAGQADPFFNLFIRQPIPHIHIVNGRMEALVDLRNLLAQGYVPVIGPDGTTVYLTQSARSVRGGLAFIF